MGLASQARSLSALLDHAPGAEHFTFIPLLDRDGRSGAQSPIDRRKGDCDIEWNFVAMCEHGLGVGADFVGYFTGSSKRAVASDDDHIDFAALHQETGGIVSDDLVGNALLGEFPGSQRCTLGTWTSLVAIYMKPLAPRLGRVERGCGTAD